MAIMGLSSALNICKDALSTAQSALGVTSNNIANVNTTGYSRQSPVIETKGSQLLGGISFGTGVELTAITKSYDQFLNINIAMSKSELGSLDVQDSYLTQIEQLFTESEDVGLDAALSDFWNAWQDLADNPEGSAERAVVQSTGESLAATISSKATSLEAIQSDANDEIASVVSSINELTTEIASLNKQIVSAEAGGASANDLTDQRTLKIEELAELTDITVLDGANGQTTILTSSGKPLVLENVSWNMEVQADAERNGLYAITLSDGKTSVDITDSISGGKLSGLLEIRDTIIPAYSDKLDVLASTLVTEVNQIHAAGYGLDGSTGNDFFTPCATIEGSAKAMSVSLSDPDTIAASQSTSVGDNSNALAMAALQDTGVIDDGTLTIGAYYSNIVANIGTDVSETESLLDSEQAILDQYEERRLAISGVSLDEEMVNLIKYQQAYTAASKMIAAIDEMLTTLLSIE